MTATSTVTVRPASELDINAIESIDEKITGTYRPDHWERQVSYYIARDTESGLVAESDGQVVGFVFGDVRGWEFGLSAPTGWIEVVGVSPDAQGKGVAKALFDQLLGHWRKQGVASARTQVANSDESLSAFMQKLGMSQAPVTTFEMSL